MGKVLCPNCKSSTVLSGALWTGEFPIHWIISSHTSGRSIHLNGNFRSCWSCGHVWTSVDPAELRACIETSSNELIREQLEPFARDPFFGLPDFPEARQAAHGVAEIDGLVLEGKIVEAIRRYRELTHTPWGPAGDDIRAWHNLKRSRKLAMFGWHEKEEVIDKKALAEDPMRDPWLDG
jgi:hypothetical protein